jgi:hypothetical protein
MWLSSFDQHWIATYRKARLNSIGGRMEARTNLPVSTSVSNWKRGFGLLAGDENGGLEASAISKIF